MVLSASSPEGDDPRGDLHESKEARHCSLHAENPRITMGCPAVLSHAQGGPRLLSTQGQPAWVSWLVGWNGWWTLGVDPPTSLHPLPGVLLQDWDSAHMDTASSPGSQDAMEGSDCGSPSWVASQSALHAEDLHVLLGCLPISSHAQGGPQSLFSQDCSVAFLRSVGWGGLPQRSPQLSGGGSQGLVGTIGDWE